MLHLKVACWQKTSRFRSLRTSAPTAVELKFSTVGGGETLLCFGSLGQPASVASVGPIFVRL